MRGINTSIEIIQKIQKLRIKGCSIQEIAKETGKSKSIVSKYIQGVVIPKKYKDILRIKQGGSIQRAKDAWNKAQLQSKRVIKSLSQKEKLLILSALYWGEGTKKELNIINSDPSMLRIVVSCFKELGIENSEIKVTLRIYNDLNKEAVIDFWSKSLSLPIECFKNINVLNGKKDGKLQYGMCRIRVEKSANYFKYIMSIIGRIKELLP